MLSSFGELVFGDTEGAPLAGVRADVRGVPVGTGHEKGWNAVLEDAAPLCQTHFGSHEMSPWPEAALLPSFERTLAERSCLAHRPNKCLSLAGMGGFW